MLTIVTTILGHPVVDELLTYPKTIAYILIEQPPKQDACGPNTMSQPQHNNQ